MMEGFGRYGTLKSWILVYGVYSVCCILSSCGKKTVSGKDGDYKTVVDDICKNMVFIGGGACLAGKYKEGSKVVTLDPFLIGKTEVTNREYNAFLEYLKVNEPAGLEDALPKFNNKVSNMQLARFNDQYFKNYFYGEAFKNYPVINLSWQQAVDYCEWLSDVVNLQRDPTYIPKRKPKMQVQPQVPGMISGMQQPGMMGGMNPMMGQQPGMMGGMNPMMGQQPGMMGGMNPMMGQQPGMMGGMADYQNKESIVFRLPTEAEWDYAASGAHGELYNGVPTCKQGVYAWGDGVSIRGEWGEWKNKIMANFFTSPGIYNGVPGEMNKIVLNTGVFDYAPNILGIYDMVGNVCEFVYDTYRDEAAQKYADYNPCRLNGDFDPQDAYSSDSGINDNMRVYKGASWFDPLYYCQVGTRRAINKDNSSPEIGFRLAMDIAMGSQNLEELKKIGIVITNKLDDSAKNNKKDKQNGGQQPGMMGGMNPMMGQQPGMMGGMNPMMGQQPGMMGGMNPMMGQQYPYMR